MIAPRARSAALLVDAAGRASGRVLPGVQSGVALSVHGARAERPAAGFLRGIEVAEADQTSFSVL
eukprot:9815173-Lingulodinium_polyedra.AAC.1